MTNVDTNKPRKLDDFAEIASDWFWESDAEHRMSYLSGRLETALGIKIADLLGVSRAQLPGAQHSAEKWRRHFADLAARRPFKNFEYSFLRPSDGKELWVRVSGRPIFDNNGIFQGYRGIGHDITEERQTLHRLEESNAALAERNRELIEVRRALERNANQDSLTGLLNRRAFERDLEEALNLSGNVVVLLHIDLDRFKWVNDTLGHPAGDVVLVKAAERLRHIASGTGPVYRVGGDEFLIVLADNAEIEQARWIGDSVIEAMEKPIPFESQNTSIGASVGIASGVGGAISLQQLVANADIALYEAKKSGRGCVRELTSDMLEQVAARRHLASEIGQAIQNDQFIPFYQPQIDAATNKIIGAEALARWQHPIHGLLAPGGFLEAATELGLVAEIDRCIMQKSMAFVDRAHAEGLDIRSMSINLSAGRLMDPNLTSDVDASWNTRRCKLSIELLETISFDEIQRDTNVMDNLAKLRAMGVNIEMDDFGSGRASITSLLSVRPDRVKIDRHLIQAAIRDQTKLKVVSAILEMARALGIESLSEGVETTEDVTVMQGLGCQLFQGYYYSRPLPEAEFVAYLQEHNGYAQWNQGAAQASM